MPKKEMAKKKGGRPPLYEELEIADKLPLIEGWIRDGATEASIQKTLGVGKDTWISWKKQYSEFSDAIKRGREMVLAITENALYKRAWGFSVQEREDLLDESGIVLNSKVKTKYYAPDTTSIIFALKNLAPEKWKDRKQQELQHSWDMSNMSDEELEAELLKLEGEEK